MVKNYNIVFLFSGQGSHYRGMGSELFSTNATFRKVIEWADRILQENTSCSLIHELYEVKKVPFNDLMITNPSILAVELAMLKVMEAMEIESDLVVGNSLGEFAAGVGAGVWSEEKALYSCIKRARTVIENAPQGGMIAVLSERTAALTTALNSFGLYVASDNFKEHFTVSGLKENINDFKEFLDRQGIICQLLDVNFPFHSPYMEKTELTNDISKGLMNFPDKTTMFSPVQGKEIQSAVGQGYFWDAVSKPFDFRKMLTQLEAGYGPCLYIDLGPSGTMATFVKYNLPQESLSIPIPLLSPFKGVEKRLQELQEKINNNTV